MLVAKGFYSPITKKTYKLTFDGFTPTSRLSYDCKQGTHQICGDAPQLLWKLGGFDPHFTKRHACLCKCHYEVEA